MNTVVRRGLLAGGVLCALIAGGVSLALPVLAQDAPTGNATVPHTEQVGEGEQNVYALPEVIVSSQKIEQRLIEVPVSINHYDEMEIENKQITDAKDLARLAPGIFVRETSGNPGNTQLYIRGLVSGGSDFFNQTVGVFSDGMNVNGGLEPQFFDVESVDVLRGPQGTLYGGNTLSGALVANSRKPVFDWETGASAAYESFNTKLFTGMVNAPLSETVAVRLAGAYRNTDGYFRNNVEDDSGAGGEDYNFRGQIRVKPSDAWNINFNLNGYNRNYDYSIYNTLQNFDDDPWETDSGNLGYVKSNALGQILTAEYDGGDVGFTSITGHRRYSSDEDNDVDFIEADLLSDRFRLDNDQYTQELRLHSQDKDARLQWVAGVYGSYEEQRTRDDYTLEDDYVASMTGMSGLGDLRMSNDVTVDVYNAALFGQGTYGLTDKLFLTLGLRYDYVTKELDAKGANVGTIAPMMGLADTVDVTGEESYSAVLPKAALEYRFTRDFNVYVSVAAGYKPGGFQTNNAALADESYDSEKSWNYEAGVKGSAFDNMMDFTAAVFYTQMEDQQLFQPINSGSSTVVQNAGESHSMGVELEARVRPIRGLELFGSYGWLDTEIDDAGDSTVTHDGAESPFAPTYKASLGGQYTFENGVFARVENEFIGPHYLDIGNKVRQDAINLLGFRVGYEFDEYGVYVYGRNLLNEEYYTMVFDNSGMMPGQDRVGTMGAPRTFGVMAKMEF
jgi:iron complex outermembrane receptor protein